MNISEEIKELISQLSNPEVKLSDLLLKVQVLAHNLKNDTLKKWVEYQENGYPDYASTPEYRRYGYIQINWIADCKYLHFNGDGTYLTEDGIPFNCEGKELPWALLSSLLDVEMGVDTFINKQDDVYNKMLPFIDTKMYFSRIISEEDEFYNIEITSIRATFTTNLTNKIIRHTKRELLKFLLELNDLIGENKNLSITPTMENKKIEEIAKNSFGNINAQNVNFIAGSNNLQNTGNDNQIALGANNSFGAITKENVFEKLREALPQIKEEVQKIEDEDDKERATAEIQRLETQLTLPNPEPQKVSKIMGALKNTYENIGWGVAGNSVYDLLKFVAAALIF